MGPALTAPAVIGEDRSTGSLLKPRWALDIISELRKVTWPSRRETANLTGVVIIVSLALGVLLGGADLFFGWLIQNTLLR
ncbi:MAG: preprotein translocase subunit SecE [Chloroflexi bacterium]|nr:MAG: preprotein translocase subunit SecE [Chloroflexota bacterium]